MKALNSFATSFVSVLVGICVSCGHKGTVDPVVESTDSVKVDSSSLISKGEKSKVSAWNLNEQNSKIEFTITNFGKEVKGTLGGLKTEIHFDKNKLPKSSFKATIPVNSINTGIAKRDKDLMHEKYFDAEKYPEITFHSDTIIKSENGYLSVGKLTIKGKSLSRKIPFTFEEKEQTGIFSSQFTLNRHDYDIGGNGPIMGDEINVSLKIVTHREGSSPK